MVHDSPPQNGVAERGMHTRAERARALLIASGLPHFLWEEAMQHTCYISFLLSSFYRLSRHSDSTPNVTSLRTNYSSTCYTFCIYTYFWFQVFF